MIEIKIPKNHAVTSVISYILIFMLISTSMATIFLYAVPEIERRKSQSEVESSAREFISFYNDILNSKSLVGETSFTKNLDVNEGYVSIDSQSNRFITMYSFDEDYDFNVSDLGVDDGNDKDITINMSKGELDSVKFFWCNNTCFLAGTKISMADGSYKNIEDIKSGDIVLSYNLNKKEFVESRVEKLLLFNEDRMDEYYLEINDNICVTPNHYFYVNNKWIRADQIKMGDLILNHHLKGIKVDSIEKVYSKSVTYDLKLESYNTYFSETFLVKSDVESNIVSFTKTKKENNDFFPTFFNMFFDIYCSNFINTYKPEKVEKKTVPHAEEKIEPVGFTCFPPGTMITMADGSSKRIEEVKAGDKVLSYDILNKKYVVETAIDIEEPIREGVYDINEGLVSPTCDHPLYVRKPDGREGWAAVDPIYCMKVHPFLNDILPLEIGDRLFTIDGKWIKIRSIDFRKGPIKVYTLDVRGTNNFFANETLAHNTCICLMPETPINMADGTYKLIKEIGIGDLVKVFDEKTKQIKTAEVKKTQCVWHENVYEIYIDNGRMLRATANHPFYTKGKSWATISGEDELGVGAGKLCVGDYLYQLNEDDSLGWVEVVDIIPFPGRYRTYNFVDMDYKTFIANDIITHNSPEPTIEPTFTTTTTFTTTSTSTSTSTTISTTSSTSTITTTSTSTSTTTSTYIPVISNPVPYDDDYDVNIEPTTPLSVDVYDGDGESLDVDFYNNENHIPIDSKTVSGSGSAEINWDNLDFYTTYSWYVNVSDGHVTVKGGPWTFETEKNTNDPPYGLGISPKISYDKYYNNTEYFFRVSGSDYEGDKLDFNISWGDGTYSVWNESDIFVSSSKEYSHIWSEPGVYDIRVKSRDDNSTDSKISPWSDLFSVNVLSYDISPFDKLSTKTQNEENTLQENPWSIDADYDLNDTVCINLYNDDFPENCGDFVKGKIPFGQIWIFDLGKIEHASYGSDAYKTIFENGGIIKANNYGSYVSDFSNIHKNNHDLMLKVTMIREGDIVLGSGPGTYKLKYEPNSLFIRNSFDPNVYNLKIKINGDNSDTWSDYFTSPIRKYKFEKQADTYDETLIYKKGKSTRLTFTSVMMEIQIDSIT